MKKKSVFLARLKPADAAILVDSVSEVINKMEIKLEDEKNPDKKSSIKRYISSLKLKVEELQHIRLEK